MGKELVFQIMEGLTEEQKELIIDLESLGLSGSVENGFYVYFHQFSEKSDRDISGITVCLLRRILRGLGFKLLKVENHLDHNLELLQQAYYTNIPEEIGDKYSKIWNEYCSEIYEDIY